MDKIIQNYREVRTVFIIQIVIFTKDITKTACRSSDRLLILKDHKLYSGVANWEERQNVENKLPDTFVADDGVFAFFSVRHIVDHIGEDTDQVDDCENRAAHIVIVLKCCAGHTHRSDQQADVAEDIERIVDFCRAGDDVFDVSQHEEGRENTTEHTIADHGQHRNAVDPDVAVKIPVHHNAAKNKDGTQHQTPQALDPADSAVGVAQHDGVNAEHIVVPPGSAPAVGEDLIADHAGQQQDVYKGRMPEIHGK